MGDHLFFNILYPQLFLIPELLSPKKRTVVEFKAVAQKLSTTLICFGNDGPFIHNSLSITHNDVFLTSASFIAINEKGRI